ncbi:hypothetical protein HK102_003825 [Quaeritorhiza haematococci]|nr:hypothetical protein HK102_003825 [Quaeritorhiza haematococci]
MRHILLAIVSVFALAALSPATVDASPMRASASQSSSVNSRLLFRRDHKKPDVVGIAGNFSAAWDKIPAESAAKKAAAGTYQEVLKLLRENGTTVAKINEDLRTLKTQLGTDESAKEFAKEVDKTLADIVQVQKLSKLHQDLEGAWNGTTSAAKMKVSQTYEEVRAALKTAGKTAPNVTDAKLKEIKDAVASDASAQNLTQTLTKVEEGVKAANQNSAGSFAASALLVTSCMAVAVSYVF